MPLLPYSIPNLLLPLMGSIVALLALPVLAQEHTRAEQPGVPVVNWQFSTYTYHYAPDDNHKNVYMLGLEREHPDAKLDGFALFTNSFGQPTVYVYPWGGVYREIGGVEHLSLKWTAGLLYGYKGPYQDKVPFNHDGFSPALIPALAYEFKPGWSFQVNFLGTAALMFQLSAALS